LTASFMTRPPSWGAEKFFRVPSNLPCAVRTAVTMTASFISSIASTKYCLFFFLEEAI